MAKYSVNTKSYEGRYLNLTIEQIQNIEKNTSTLNWTLTATGGKSKYYTVYPTTIKIAGIEVYSKEKTAWDTYEFPAAAGSVEGSIEVEHEGDGSKTVDVYFYTGVFYSSYQQDYGGSFPLDKIPRANSIAVSNYNLGQNISVTIGKKVDAFTSTLTYKIGERTGTLIEKTNESSYVWEMDEELISQIKQDNPSNAKPSATIYCDTYSGDTKIGSTQSATFTLSIIDKPIIDNVVINETIELIKQYTTSIVKYLSVPQFNISAIPSEGTSIKSYRVKIGDKEIISSTDGLTINNIQYSYLIDDIRKTKFIVTVTDTRENVSDEYPIEMDFIEYVQLAFNNTDIKLTRLNGTSNFIKLHMTGYIYNGLIGETPNTLRMQYQYRLKSDSTAEWSDNKSIEATLNEDNTFIIDNLQLEDEFDYRENYEIVFWIQDLFSANYYLGVIKTSETILKVHKNGIDVKSLTIDGKELSFSEKQTIFNGTLMGGESVNLSNVKRYLDVYFRVNFSQADGIGKYTIDTNIDANLIYSSGVIMAFDGSSGQEYYISESSYNKSVGELIHVRTGYFNISSGSYTARGDNPSYYIYRIDTYDQESSSSSTTSSVNQNIYSSEEQVIGTWFGKPLYRKVISTYTSYNTTLEIMHEIENTDKIWIDFGNSYYRANNSTMIPLNANSYWGDFAQMNDAMVYNDRIILYSTGGWAEGWEKVITLHYTKTTD